MSKILKKLSKVLVGRELEKVGYSVTSDGKYLYITTEGSSFLLNVYNQLNITGKEKFISIDKSSVDSLNSQALKKNALPAIAIALYRDSDLSECEIIVLSVDMYQALAIKGTAFQITDKKYYFRSDKFSSVFGNILMLYKKVDVDRDLVASFSLLLNA